MSQVGWLESRLEEAETVASIALSVSEAALEFVNTKTQDDVDEAFDRLTTAVAEYEEIRASSVKVSAMAGDFVAYAVSYSDETETVVQTHTEPQPTKITLRLVTDPESEHNDRTDD